jgi:uncharacterized protein YdaU (DUF1376 family)
MTKLPSMPFFPADFFADTAHMPGSAARCYLFLLGHAWLAGGKLPNNDLALARMARMHPVHWGRVKDHVLGFWELGNDGFLRNKRLSKELEYVRDKVERNRKNGALGGAAKHKVLDTPKACKGRTQRNELNALKYNEASQANAKAPTLTPIKKESLNGEIRQKRENQHWVGKGSPQWNAWESIYLKLHGRPPLVIEHYETREEGMFFPSEWPPTSET